MSKYLWLETIPFGFPRCSVGSFRWDMPSRTHGISFSPTLSHACPRQTTENLKYLLPSICCHTHEKTGDFSRRVLGRRRNEPVYMIRHDFNCQECKSVWGGDFRQPYYQPCFDRANQNLLPITRYPYAVIVDDIGAMWAVVDFCRHRHMVAKEGSFLHLLKSGDIRRHEL